MGRGKTSLVATPPAPATTRLAEETEINARRHSGAGRRIAAVDVFGVEVPLASDFATRKSAGAGRVRKILVRLRSADGLTGVGEGSPSPAWNLEAPETTVAAIRRILAPELIGLDSLAVNQVHQAMHRVLPDPSYRSAKCAIDVACHDLAARALEVPVYRLLGGGPHEQLPVLWGLGLRDRDAAVADARARERAGHRLIKVKIGRDPIRDAGVVVAVRGALSPETQVSADANEGYTRGEALRFGRALRDHDLFCLEQPLARQDLVGLASLRAATGVPIMLDESVMSPTDLVAAIRHGAGDYLFLKLDNFGGLAPARVAGLMARGAQIVPIAGGSLNTEIGAAALIHLAAALDLTGPGGFNGPLLLEHPLTVRPGLAYLGGGGAVQVPHGPGLGIELDEAAVRACRWREPS